MKVPVTKEVNHRNVMYIIGNIVINIEIFYMVTDGN